ncbi:hypothetical protein ACA910_016751 [Epithemia clementina (nom. ined.)]
MKTFQIVALFALFAAAMAFAPNQAPKIAKAAFTKAAVPAAAFVAAAPAFAAVDFPTNTLALEVQFGAYLAVALGTLLPCLFLINLFIQTESRKAGRSGGLDAE